MPAPSHPDHLDRLAIDWNTLACQCEAAFHANEKTD
jgi:hypothetical protein